MKRSLECQHLHAPKKSKKTEFYLNLEYTRLRVPTSQKPLILGNDNEDLQHLLPDFVPPVMAHVWVSDNMESITIQPCTTLQSRLFQTEQRKFITITLATGEFQMFPGDIFDLIYDSETHGGQFSFVLEMVDEVDLESSFGFSSLLLGNDAKTKASALNNCPMLSFKKYLEHFVTILKPPPMEENSKQQAPTQNNQQMKQPAQNSANNNGSKLQQSQALPTPPIKPPKKGEFHISTLRMEAARVRIEELPVLIASGPNLLAIFPLCRVRISFFEKSRFSIECSTCKDLDADVHLFGCIHGWVALISAFRPPKVPSAMPTLSVDENAFLGNWRGHSEQNKMVDFAAFAQAQAYQLPIFVFPTCIYILFFDCELCIHFDSSNIWVIQCSCTTYEAEKSCFHTTVAMSALPNVPNMNCFQDATNVCEKLWFADSNTLVDFVLSFAFNYKLDLQLCTQIERVEALDQILAANLMINPNDVNLYTLQPLIKVQHNRCSIAYVAPYLISECDGYVTTVELNVTRDRVVKTKCECNFMGLFWCAHVAFLVSQSNTVVFDYYQLKRAVALIPRENLFFNLFSLFSSISLVIELGISHHLNKELINEWMERSTLSRDIPFLDQAPRFFQDLQRDYEIWSKRSPPGQFQMVLYNSRPIQEEILDNCRIKLDQLASAGDYDNAFKLLYGMTQSLKVVGISFFHGLIDKTVLENHWTILFQQAPLTAEQSLAWSERLALCPNSSGFKYAQSQVMMNYSMMFSDEESLDESIGEALEDSAKKYSDARLLGFATGAEIRGMHAAAFLLCLKALILNALKVSSEPKLRVDIISLFCKALIDSNKGTELESMNGVETLFQISSRSAAKKIYTYYKTDDNFQLDLSTLYSTLTGFPKNMLGAILAEFSVLASWDYMKDSKEILVVAEALLNAGKRRHAFEVGLLAHTLPDTVELEDLERIFDIAFSATSPTYLARLVAVCLASPSDIHIIQLVAKLVKHGAKRHAFSLAIKAAKINWEENVNLKNPFAFIVELCQELGDDNIYNEIDELAFSMIIERHDLNNLKNKLKQIGFYKSWLVLSAQTVDIKDRFSDDEFVKSCLECADKNFSIPLLKRHILGVRDAEYLIDRAREFWAFSEYKLAWDTIVWAAHFVIPLAPNGSTKRTSFVQSGSLLANKDLVDVALLAFSISLDIPGFDLMNVVEFISDFVDHQSTLELIKRQMDVQIEGQTPVQFLHIVHQICICEYLKAAHDAVTFVHCGHQNCDTCLPFYSEYAGILRALSNYGKVLSVPKATTEQLFGSLTNPHSEKGALMNAINLALKQKPPPYLITLQSRLQAAKLGYSPILENILTPQHNFAVPPPLSPPANEFVNVRTLRTKLGTLQHSLTLNSEKTRIARGEIQNILRELHVIYQNAQTKLLENAKYSKYL